MSKTVGQYIIKEDVIRKDNRRVYRQAIIQGASSREQIQWVCQILNKPPYLPHLEDSVQKIIRISNRNVQVFKDIKETKNNYYIFMDQFNDGVLSDIVQQEYINEDSAKHILKQILNGLKSLHENDVFNIDLNFSSIFRHNGDIKIGQVNLALDQMAHLEVQEDFDQFDVCKEIQAPEILSGKSKGSMASDLYSIGVIYYKLLFKSYPFNGTTKSELLKQIQNHKINISAEQKQLVSEVSIDFIKRVLIYEPENRMKWTQVYTHKLLELMNAPSDKVVQSVLLNMSMNKMITKSNIDVKSFDVGKLKSFYQNKEQGKQHRDNTEQSTLVINQENKTPLDQDGLKEMETQSQLNMQLFKDQRIKAFKQQLDNYIFQRNIYTSLCNSLTNVRLIGDKQFQTRQLEFLLLKCIYIFANALCQQLEEINPQAHIIKNNDKADGVFDCYNVLKIQINREFEIIQQQFNSFLPVITKFVNSNKITTLNNLINNQMQITVFQLLKDQLFEFIKQLPQSYLFQRDQQAVEYMKCYFIAGQCMVVSYLLNMKTESYLGTDPREYIDHIQTANLELLKSEYQQRTIRLDQAYTQLNIKV